MLSLIAHRIHQPLALEIESCVKIVSRDVELSSPHVVKMLSKNPNGTVFPTGATGFLGISISPIL